VRYEHVPLEQLRRRFVAKLGAGEAQASAKLSSGKGLSDLKPFYGHVFDDLLGGYTHWGWVDWDILLGDLAAVVGEEALWASDAVTFAGATLGFAWAGGSRRRRRGGRVEGCPAQHAAPFPRPQASSPSSETRPRRESSTASTTTTSRSASRRHFREGSEVGPASRPHHCRPALRRSRRATGSLGGRSAPSCERRSARRRTSPSTSTWAALPRLFRDSSETPPRHLRDISETPPRHL